mgnify:CR=1 FL=1|jgi:hypothetical protein
MNHSLIATISMALDCGELMNDNQRRHLEAGLARLKSGQHMTPEQSGYWGAYVKRIRSAR